MWLGTDLSLALGGGAPAKTSHGEDLVTAVQALDRSCGRAPDAACGAEVGP